MKRYTATFLIPALVTLIVLFYPQQISMSGVVAGQKPVRRLPRRVPKPPTAGVGADYSRFSHATQKHQGACNTCHRVPTNNWKKVREFPDVADYPDHYACVSCHRPQFFKGAKPVICSVCHSKVSPRDDARFAFRNPASRRQFSVEFPHDKHQDVIASMLRPAHPAGVGPMGKSLSPRVTQTVSLRVWAHSRVVTTEASQPIKHPSWAAQLGTPLSLRYNNCEICHSPRTTPPMAPATGWIDSFVPDAATFKTVPTSHAECFSCHWKAQQPTSENCAGCHKLGDKPYFLVAAPKRFSIKFRHAREQHTAECTTCHINITKATTLRGLKPDVPITSCTECHNKDGLRLDVSKELEALDKNRDFVCSYCHASDVGRRDPPAGHYLIGGREALKRRDIK